MALPRSARRAALGAAVATTVSAVVAAGITFATSSDAATTDCGVFYDDFGYGSTTDPAFARNGWSARTNGGSPGMSGARWSADAITFPTVDGQKVAQLQGSTNGTGAGTVQAEFLQGRRRFFNGTYASRIKFSDTPVDGVDGDHVNETYFVIGPEQRFDYDPQYSELDFSEYLPNGGWGGNGPTDYETSYNGFKEDPWAPHNAVSQQSRSMAGWHTVVTQVGGGHVKYYIDGVLAGDHTVDQQTGTFPVYPRVPMSLSYNLWFIDGDGHSGGTSTYTEAVDWTYYIKDQTLSPDEAVSRAGGIRTGGATHQDTLDVTTGCGTTMPPTTKPATTTAPATKPPATPPTTAVPPGVAQWAVNHAYSIGDIVTYGGLTYRDRQAHTSLPGWEPPNVPALWEPVG